MDGTGIALLLSLFGTFGLLDRPIEPIGALAIERYGPTRSDRDLDLTLLHLPLRRKSIEPWGLYLEAGVTVARATGSITQLAGSWEAGTLRSDRLDSPGWGIGPTVDIRLDGPMWGPFRPSLSAGASLLIHDRDFPAGGRRYNGLFRIGPGFSWSPAPGHRITIGYQWLHLSNGSGLTPRNPSYDGRGPALRYEWRPPR